MTRFAVREWGTPGERNLVFLHGLGVIGPEATDEPAAAWAALGFRVLAPDLPGFGGSEPLPRPGYLPSRLARLLLSELPEQFALVGFSWGGTIAAHLTVAAPRRVQALVLVDVGYSAPVPGPPSYDELLEGARAELALHRFANAAAFLESARPHFRGRLSDEALLRSLREAGGELVPVLEPEVYAAAMRGVHDEPPVQLHEALRETGTPILLLVAGQPPSDERDEEVAAFRRALPGAEVIRYPHSGHNVLLDAGEDAIPAVGAWLARHARS